ncbi:hypothetical protein FOMPIDRAFT_1052796 [Fomitopsis schrenkii]|uniref:Uncharacterized protein n=1 Tax=Fomitopsis schrenkii TaxID=2126942 RepID=S8F5G7_FOMSC|nr:hypothetical protein FOMPIDRAFT_1052796 [Fomitopsis schrenkii]
MRGSADGDEDEQDAQAKLQALPEATVRLGLLAHLSLDNPRAGETRTRERGSPAYNTNIRTSLFENHSPPQITIHGSVTPDDVDELFDVFYTRLNVSIVLCIS